jgi:hypothetical protein
METAQLVEIFVWNARIINAQIVAKDIFIMDYAKILVVG